VAAGAIGAGELLAALHAFRPRVDAAGQQAERQRRCGVLRGTEQLRSGVGAITSDNIQLSEPTFLKGDVLRSVADRQAAINRFLAETNSDPMPFIWTGAPKRVLAAVSRGKRT
jgi:hypothetical protein